MNNLVEKIEKYILISWFIFMVIVPPAIALYYMTKLMGWQFMVLLFVTGVPFFVWMEKNNKKNNG